MKKETADKLKGIFDKYDKMELASKQEQARAKSEHELFLEYFDKLMADVIRPSMEEFIAILESRGHGGRDYSNTRITRFTGENNGSKHRNANSSTWAEATIQSAGKMSIYILCCRNISQSNLYIWKSSETWPNFWKQKKRICPRTNNKRDSRE